MQNKIKVSCFGAGFVGLPTSSVLALKNPNANFVIFDIDEKRINKCSEGVMPIYQPKLQEVFASVFKKNLTLSTKISDALDNVSVIFLALPTPTKTFGQDSGMAYDLSYTQRAVLNIIQYYNKNPGKMLDNVIIVQKSTVPIGTAKLLKKIINANSIPLNKNKYILTSNPQFLAQGSAIDDLMTPDRIVIGTFEKDSDIKNLLNLYAYAGDRIINTNSSSSQMAKLVANCFLAQRVSSINSIAMMCEQYDADIVEVKKCIASDQRIGDKFLNSSIGFGGSCFRKDILALIYLAKAKGLNQVADYWMNVINMNTYRKSMFFKRVFHELHSNLKGKKLAIFGTAFKKGTCDARDSPAIDICRDLLEEGAILQVYDVKTAKQNFIYEMKYNQAWKDCYEHKITQFSTPEEATVDASAILIMTEWDEFINIKYSDLKEKMQKPAYIFDGRNILDGQKLKQMGFYYFRIGRKFQGYEC